MDSRERVVLAIRHREIDRIPTGEIAIAEKVIKESLEVDHVEFPERREFVTRLGIDVVCEPPQWRADPISLPKAGGARWDELHKWATCTDRFVFAMLDGVFGWGMRIMGFERFLTASLQRSSQLMELMHGVESLNVELAGRAANAGANGVLIADDIAYQRDTTVHPTLLRELFFPSLARQVSGIASTEIPIFFHSDGNLSSVIDDLVNVGFQGLQCLESQAGMDLAVLKASYGERICLWGNLDPKRLFLEQSSEELEAIVNSIIEVAAPGSGFIFGTSSGLVEGMRRENIEAVYRAVHMRDQA